MCFFFKLHSDQGLDIPSIQPVSSHVAIPVSRQRFIFITPRRRVSSPHQDQWICADRLNLYFITHMPSTPSPRSRNDTSIFRRVGNCVPAWRSWWKIQIYGKIHPCSPLHVVILYPPGNGSDLSGKKVLSTCTRSIFPHFFASEICMIYECSRATLIVVAQVHFGSAKSDWSRSGALLAGIES